MPTIQTIDSSAFERLIKDNRHVIVDFYSTDCPPCANLAPIYEQMAEKYPQAVFVKIMRQDNRELAQSLFVMSSPTVLFFRDGQMLEPRLTGNVTENELEQIIKQLIV